MEHNVICIPSLGIEIKITQTFGRFYDFVSICFISFAAVFHFSELIS